MFEENSSGHFDAKIYSNISIKLALKKVCVNIFCSTKVFLILCQHIYTKFQYTQDLIVVMLKFIEVLQ